MSKIKTIVIFLLLSSRFFSQNIDSIYSSISSINNDSVKIYKILAEIVNPLIDKRDFLKADAELKKAKKFINGNVNNEFRFKSAGIQLLISQEKYDAANDSIELQLTKAKKLNNNYYLSNFLRYKALIQLYLGNLDKSTEIYFTALKKMKLTNFQNGIAMAYSDIGMVSYYNEQFDKAAEFWEKSAEIYEKENRKDFLSNELSNLSLAYLDNNNLVKAERVLKKALALANELKSENSKASIYTNFTKLEYNKKNLTKAIEYNDLAAKYYESIKNYDKLSNIYSNGAELARTNKQYNEALAYIKDRKSVV